MEKIALSLFVLIAVVAFVGLIKLDTGTGNAYYTSYQYLTVRLSGAINAPNGHIEGYGDDVLVGRGEITNGAYQMTLSSGWREHLKIDIFVNGESCTSVAVPIILNTQKIHYQGNIVLDLEC